MKFYGVEGTCRASFAAYNTEEEVEVFVTGVKRAVQMLRGQDVSCVPLTYIDTDLNS